MVAPTHDAKQIGGVVGEPWFPTYLLALEAIVNIYEIYEKS